MCLYRTKQEKRAFLFLYVFETIEPIFSNLEEFECFEFFFERMPNSMYNIRTPR